MCPAGPDVDHNGPLRYLTCGQVTLYYSCVVDVRHLRTVHCVDHYPCLPDPQKISGTAECGAVHYGYCVPIMLDAGDSLGNKLDHHPVAKLLASPTLDNNLKSLVNRFVAQDKATRLPTMTQHNAVEPSKVETFKPAVKNVQNNMDRAEKINTQKTAKKNNESIEIQSEKLGQLLSDLKLAVSSGSDKKKDVLLSSAAGGSGANGQTAKGSVQKYKSSYPAPNKSNKSVDVLLTDALECQLNTTANQEVTGIGVNAANLQKRKSSPSNKPSVDVEQSLTGALEGSMSSNTMHDFGVTNNTTTKCAKMQMSSRPCASGDDDVEQRLMDAVKNPISVRTVQAVVDTLSRDERYIQSPVDYAKKRFQLSQAAPFSSNRTCSPLNGIPHLVSETKSRFENGYFQAHDAGSKWKTEWLPKTDDSPMLSTAMPPTPRKSPSPEPPGSSNSPLPHPKLTLMQKQHIRERALAPLWVAVESATSDSSATGSLPIRPFLTKGSVAERVLIFERCPVLDKGSNRTHQAHYATKPLFNTWRTSTYETSKPQQITDSYPIDAALEYATSAALLSSTKRAATKAKGSSQCKGDVGVQRAGQPRFTSDARHCNIPRFYYPHGRPLSSTEADSQVHAITAAFAKLDRHMATQENFCLITKVCQLPLYWKLPLFFASGGDIKNQVTCDQFLAYWKRLLSTCHDDASKFVSILTKGQRKHLLPEDFISLIQDVIDTHPGLTFLKEAMEFHSRYVHTVIARIYYCTNRSWSGKISVPELRKSNFLQVLSILEDEEDINQVTEYFSYEHFYVIYCKFWELDKDHDLFIDKVDLARHNENAISSRMIERIFCGAVTHGKPQQEGRMGYSEFVWFLLSEEDKSTPTSIEYWFRCMDLDGDGLLSMYELEYFYEEQLQRMETLGIETLPFQDCLCQMLDMIQPNIPEKISLADLKRCKMTPIFFDTFFNLEKYLDHEQRDPFASHRDQDAEGLDTSDWNRYAAEEYELLVAEEGAAEQQDDLLYDDEYQQEEDELCTNLEDLAIDECHHGRVVVRSADMLGNGAKAAISANPRVTANSDDDYADYAAESDDYQY